MLLFISLSPLFRDITVLKALLKEVINCKRDEYSKLQRV